MADTLYITPATQTQVELKTEQTQTLRIAVERALENYFAQLDDQLPTNLYDIVLAEVEIPLIEAVMKKTGGNQTKAAILLGLSRGTLRKLLKQYNID